MPENVVEIIVRSKNETNFDEIRRDARSLGDDVAKGFEDQFAQRVANLRTRVKSSLDRAGSDIGDDLGERIGRRVSERIRQSVTRAGGGQPRDERGRFTSGARSGGIPDDDEGSRSFVSRMGSVGRAAGEKLTDGIGDRVDSFFSGDIITIIVKALAAAAIVPVIAVPLAAMISSAVLLALGGGVIALGVAAAFKDPRIQAAAGELGDKVGTMFGKFGEHFRGPVANFLEDLSGWLDDIAPRLDQLGEKLGPLAERLGDGIIGMLQNLLPGIIDALEDSEPIVEVLADRLPDIGQALGDFFRMIGEQGDDAALFFNDLITVIIKLIGFIGGLVSGLTRMYSHMRRLIRGSIDLFWDLWGAVRGAFDRIDDKTGAVFRAVRHYAGVMGNVVRGIINSIKSAINTISFGGVIDRAANAAGAIGGFFGRFFASGGVAGAASGGIRSGLSWVGEHGPELVRLPAGATVHSASDSQRMWRGQPAGGGGGFAELVVSAKPSASRDLMGALLGALQYECRTNYQGSAQRMIGQPGVTA